jgi:hypothetical protein
MPATTRQMQHNKIPIPMTRMEVSDFFSVPLFFIKLFSDDKNKVFPSYPVRVKEGLGNWVENKRMNDEG